MRVLGLVPARGGSKGVARKNIRELRGAPLLAYTARAALAARTLTRVVLTTEDQEIAEIGASLGLDVPFLRPETLARDETPMLPVVQHAVATLEAVGDVYDAVCLLQPTNPLRTPQDIDACVNMLLTTTADCVVTVLPVPHVYNPHWVYLVGGDGFLHLSTGDSQPIPRRQALPPAFHREGSVYVTRRDVLVNRGSLYGDHLACYEMDASRSVNIDAMEDWERAEMLLAGQL
jgi:CMP-N-acetylneuraminic acid synthetase